MLQIVRTGSGNPAGCYGPGAGPNGFQVTNGVKTVAPRAQRTVCLLDHGHATLVTTTNCSRKNSDLQLSQPLSERSQGVL
jgi:hypothetical protein